MLSSTAPHRAGDTAVAAKPDKETALTRKVWLPRVVYVCLPWFYLAAGASALLATIYISHWSWIVPYYLLFSIGCLHLAIVVIGRRRSGRRSDRGRFTGSEKRRGGRLRP